MTDKTSYALGLSIAAQFKTSGIHHLDIDSFTEAIKDTYENIPQKITFQEAQELVKELFSRIMQEEKEVNLRAGEEYQKILKEKNGVVTLPSGIQYEILKKGDGEKPSPTDTVEVHYQGTLINGTVFDSSRKRGTTAKFPLNGVIPGWTAILQLMPVGSIWRVVIPAPLAYGERGSGDVIRPNMTLIFEIELISILSDK